MLPRTYLVSVLALVLQAICGPSTSATCLSSFSWLDNSLGQSPCLAAAYAMGACDLDDTWNVEALGEIDDVYKGPMQDQANACTCNSVSYSLMSACNLCQTGEVPVWLVWTANCSSSEAVNGGYPHSIPDGTAFPAWAYATVVVEWDDVQAEIIAEDKEPDSVAVGPTSAASSASSSRSSASVGGYSNSLSSSSSLSSNSSATAFSAADTLTPGFTPVASVEGQSFTFSPVHTFSLPIDTGLPTTTGSPDSSVKSSKNQTNLAAIIGGAVGGGVGLMLMGTLVFIIYRWRRTSRHEQLAYAAARPSSVPPLMPSPAFEEKVPRASYSPNPAAETNTLLTPLAPLRLYNPEDPSTFPDAVSPLHPQSGTTSPTFVDSRISSLPQMPQSTQPIPEV